MMLSHYYRQYHVPLKVSSSLMTPSKSISIFLFFSIYDGVDSLRDLIKFLYCFYVIDMISLYKFIIWRPYVKRCVVFS